MRAAGVAAALAVAMCGLGGCTGAPRSSGSEPGTAAVLPPGRYIAGQDLASGLYVVTVNSGPAGFLSIKGPEDDPVRGIVEIVGIPEVVGPGVVPMVRVEISDGDEVVLKAGARGEFTLAFTPVTSRRIEPIDGQVVVHAGTWSVGDDIAPGRYLAEVGPGQRGWLIVSDGRVDVNLETTELLDGDGSADGQTNVALDLAVGDRVLVVGLSEVTLRPV